MKNIPIENIYYLLAYAWDKLPESKKIHIEGCAFQGEVNLLAFVLGKGVTHLLKRGFDRDYRVFEENTCLPRGKWDIQTTLKKGLLAQNSVHCEYTEMDHNLLHNQIIKTTLKRLICTEGLDKNIKKDIHQLYFRMGGIDQIDLSERLFRKIRLHRNNAFYGFLLNICELIYTNLLPTETTGHFQFRDFLQDENKMAVLFEAFVRNFYRMELSSTEYRSIQREILKWDMQGLTPEDDKKLPQQMTDTTITYWDNRKIIIETKYYAQILKENYYSHKLSADNLRQITTYLDLCPQAFEGILIYAQTDCKLDMHYQKKGKKLRVYSLDLGQPWQAIHTDLISLLPA